MIPPKPSLPTITKECEHSTNCPSNRRTSRVQIIHTVRTPRKIHLSPNTYTTDKVTAYTAVRWSKTIDLTHNKVELTHKMQKI